MEHNEMPSEEPLGQMEIDFDPPGMKIVGLYWDEARRDKRKVELTSIGGGEYRDESGRIYIPAVLYRPSNDLEPRFERTDRRVDDRPDEDFFA